jgi:hypothetical protein
VSRLVPQDRMVLTIILVIVAVVNSAVSANWLLEAAMSHTDCPA